MQMKSVHFGTLSPMMTTRFLKAELRNSDYAQLIASAVEALRKTHLASHGLTNEQIADKKIEAIAPYVDELIARINKEINTGKLKEMKELLENADWDVPDEIGNALFRQMYPGLDAGSERTMR